MNESGIVELRNQAISLWHNLSRAQQMAILSIFVVAGILIFFLLSWARTPEYATVFSNLSEEDAAAVVAKLKESKTPYELAGGGTTVRVPSNMLYETRLQLASAGLPQGGKVGFELFSQTNFGMTDFAQKVNYQRALEGELSRTINHLGPVEQCRVHLAIPQATLYTDNQKEASASVVLKLRPGQKLKDSQIRGITQLVSSSVEGMKPENVTVVDSAGNILSEAIAGSKDAPRMTATQLDAQKAFETDLEQRVQGMLDRVLGPGKAQVRARALLDWDQFESSSETYSPANTKPQVRSSRESTESYGSLAPTSGGPPGSASNLPAYSGIVTGTRGLNGAAGQYEKKDVTNNYELSKVVEKTSRAPGGVKKLSVAVVLDDGLQLGAPQIEEVSRLVSAAAGIDTNRGDVLAVSSIPFNREAFSSDIKAIEEAQKVDTYLQIGKLAAMAIGPVLLLLLLLLATRRGRQPRDVMIPAAAGALPGGAAMAAAELAGPAAVAVLGETEQIAVPPPIHIPDPQKKMIREQVTSLAQNSPEVMAALIKTWLKEGK